MTLDDVQKLLKQCNENNAVFFESSETVKHLCQRVIAAENLRRNIFTGRKYANGDALWEVDEQAIKEYDAISGGENHG